MLSEGATHPDDSTWLPLTPLVSVLLPLPLGRTYSYTVPPELDLAPGDFVCVPLGGREVAGVVWDNSPNPVPSEKLKAVRGRLPVPAMASTSMRFVEWVATYNMASIGAVLRMVISVPAALEAPRPIKAFSAVVNPPDFKMTAARARVLAVLDDTPPLSTAELARLANVGPAVVRGLAKAGALASIELPTHARFQQPNPDTAGPTLSADQTNAAVALRAAVTACEFSATLLEGLPGSGKTEVYFEAIAEALRHDRQALVLLPEIALSAQWLKRFRQRFGAAPAEWHSDLTQARRRETWRAVAVGDAQVVVGARSALFLPFPDLGFIAVDEEHDSSFKQEDGVIYNARDMAVVRANLQGIPIALVSATPSLETLTNVERGRYGREFLPDRHGGASLPSMELVDLRAEKLDAGNWLSPKLIDALKQTFAAREQAILFLNRRGYAPLTLCRTCGQRLECPQCTAWLVEHRLLSRLQCHHCGYQTALPETCPVCEDTKSLTACGPGVERLAEEVERLFPKINYVVAASDTIWGPAQAANLVEGIEERNIDLLIGTQMVAKGYHFPFLTLVGVVDADLGLAGGDLRAAERTYQLLYQVAGRAGRADRPGQVLLQTYMPEHPVMRALVAGDRESFLNAESEGRRAAGMPPFGRLVGVIVSGHEEVMVSSAARALSAGAPRGSGIEVLGPAPAPMSLLRGRYRYRLLVKAPRDINVQAALRRWMNSARLPRKVRVQLDVDPYSFM